MSTILPQFLGTEAALSSTKPERSAETRSETKTDNALVPALRSSVPASAQPTLPASITRLIGAYLYDEDLNKFSESNFFSPGACQGDVDTRKAVRENLLLHVFNANPDGVDAFFKKKGVPRGMALIKAGFKEGYESEKFKKFVLFREYLAISPLQSAARTGDIFLLIQNLLAPIIQDASLEDAWLLEEARQQLIEVRQSASEQKMLLDAANAIYEIQFGETDVIKEAASIKFNTIRESEEFKAQMEAFGNTMAAMRKQLEAELVEVKTKDAKEASPKKASNDTVESKDIYAENQEFLEPLINLIKAYIYYYITFPIINWDQIEKLWEYVGEWHRRLYPYVHQEFCDEKPFNPRPAFQTTPSRGPCRYHDNTQLSLDRLGIGTLLGLYKGAFGQAGVAGGVFAAHASRAGGAPASQDLWAVAHLYTIRLTGLDYIINALGSLDTAKSLVNNYNASHADAARAKP